MTSTLLSDKREVEALTRRSVKFCTELVESWRETEGTWGATNDDDDDENPGDKTGTMSTLDSRLRCGAGKSEYIDEIRKVEDKNEAQLDSA